MSDSDSRSPSDQPASAGGSRNLPVPVPPAAPVEKESFFAWVLRNLFGRKPETFRADLRSALEGRSGDNGFSPRESTMLQNILALRERRAVDVMIPRADIIAVQRDIPLGELMKVFESAGHSRLVVYDDTLDDAVGMVHIRDLIAYMTARAAVGARTNTRRKKPFPAGLDLKAVDLATPLSAAKIVREMLFVPPSMPVMDLLARMQTSRIHLALIVDEYGGADGVVSIEDVVEEIVGDIADEHDEDFSARRGSSTGWIVPRRCAGAAGGRDCHCRSRLRGQRGGEGGGYACRLYRRPHRARAAAWRACAGAGAF